MRIAMMTHRFPAASETFIAALFVRLVEAGSDAHVICVESPASDRELFPQLDEHRRRIHRSWPSRSRLRALLLLPFALLRCALLTPRRTLAYLVRGWPLFGPKVVWRAYVDAELIVLGPDVIHFQFGVFARGRERIGELLDCAVVVSFQGADLNYVGLEQDPGYYAEVWRHADGIHFLGEDLKRRAGRRGYVDDERSQVIRPGVDTSAFAPGPREPLAGRSLRILSVGRLHWKKGYEYAVEALSLLRDRGVSFDHRIVGDGDFRAAIEQAVDASGLDASVQLLGVQSLDCVRDEMQTADVLLHAAVSEGFCYVAVEAQAMELPVVTSDADGLPENVADGETGFVVARRDPRSLADRLETIAHDDALRVRFGKAGRERAITAFAPERQVKEFIELYARAKRRSQARRRSRLVKQA